MNILSAALLVIRAPYSFRRSHEWRGYSVQRGVRLWPLVTMGWWTWDPLPEVVGRRLAEQVDTLANPPVKPVEGQQSCL